MDIYGLGNQTSGPVNLFHGKGYFASPYIPHEYQEDMGKRPASFGCHIVFANGNASKCSAGRRSHRIRDNIQSITNLRINLHDVVYEDIHMAGGRLPTHGVEETAPEHTDLAKSLITQPPLVPHSVRTVRIGGKISDHSAGPRTSPRDFRTHDLSGVRMEDYPSEGRINISLGT